MRFSAALIIAGDSKFAAGASAMSLNITRPRKLRHIASSAAALRASAATATSAITPTRNRRMSFTRLPSAYPAPLPLPRF